MTVTERMKGLLSEATDYSDATAKRIAAEILTAVAEIADPEKRYDDLLDIQSAIGDMEEVASAVVETTQGTYSAAAKLVSALDDVERTSQHAMKTVRATNLSMLDALVRRDTQATSAAATALAETIEQFQREQRERAEKQQGFYEDIREALRKHSDELEKTL